MLSAGLCTAPPYVGRRSSPALARMIEELRTHVKDESLESDGDGTGDGKGGGKGGGGTVVRRLVRRASGSLGVALGNFHAALGAGDGGGGKREAEEKAKREAEEKAKRAAEEKLKRETEEKAKRAAHEKAERAPCGEATAHPQENTKLPPRRG